MRSRRSGVGDDGAINAVAKGDMVGTASGDAAMMVRRRWERLRSDGFLDEPRLEFDKPPVHWHWDVAVVILGLALLSVGSLLVS